ncbi:hypothetical protein [Serratia sp. NPDC087055]|uniref:hypothetical protein n=1 Tax=Serratia sp. NPDC087055 TaxID=3364516 RepID=UPI00384A6413
MENVNIPSRINLLLGSQSRGVDVITLSSMWTFGGSKILTAFLSRQKWMQELIDGMYVTPFCQCAIFHVERDAVAPNPEAVDAASSSRHRQHQPLGPVRRVKLTNIV